LARVGKKGLPSISNYARIQSSVAYPFGKSRSLLMYIDDFVWLPDVIEKLIVKHYVTQDEVEEVFFNDPHYRFIERGHRSGEDVYSAGGQTDTGRYLIVFFIHKVVTWPSF
jgi:uncharacterized DUF497 family protein